jgi:transcriptional regulator with XRE-family HTH domain
MLFDPALRRCLARDNATILRRAGAGGRMSMRRADANDALVGHNIRVQRLAKKMSQGALAGLIGISFQQLQKYENGTNRVGAGRLVRIAAALNVPVMTLLDGVAAQGRAAEGLLPSRLLANRHPLRLAQAFATIEDRNVRAALLALTEGFARMAAARVRR